MKMEIKLTQDDVKAALTEYLSKKGFACDVLEYSVTKPRNGGEAVTTVTAVPEGTAEEHEEEELEEEETEEESEEELDEEPEDRELFGT